jgi:hypothetical protein
MQLALIESGVAALIISDNAPLERVIREARAQVSSSHNLMAGRGR